MKKFFLFVFCTAILFCSASCGKKIFPDNAKVLHTSTSRILASLDPVLAADTICQSMTAALYDTPLQYNYKSRPYRLECSMLEKMPEILENGTVIRCTLRDDLFFQENECFGKTSSQRKITSRDMIFSIKRLADTRLRSTGYWLIRGKIKGLEEFRKRTEEHASVPWDLTPYDAPCPGFRIPDNRTFEIVLTKPDPRFLYALAMPYFSCVSRRAVEYWKDAFQDHPCGSGPFTLVSWRKDHSIILKRNSQYRKEFYPHAENPAERQSSLPLLDGVICNFVKQPMAGWLMFLQGELDSCALDGENFAAVVNRKKELSPALTKRGIVLEKVPSFETNYIGFLFSDPVVGKNVNLRRAISLAFNREKLNDFFAGRFAPANGPVPPGADGYLSKPGPYGVCDVERAKAFMKLAGYPDGIAPATGKALVLEFDQAGSGSFYRQFAELLAIDLRKIGIELHPGFNNRARFLQKIAMGQTQLFRLSWTGDYPDAENFFQLFYSANAGASNRVCYSSPVFDRMYREAILMPDSPERREKYLKMARFLSEDCPWIFESHPVSFLLKHAWYQNEESHDFAFNAWKYYSIDPEKKNHLRKTFTPLGMRDLQK